MKRIVIPEKQSVSEIIDIEDVDINRTTVFIKEDGKFLGIITYDAGNHAYDADCGYDYINDFFDYKDKYVLMRELISNGYELYIED